MKLLEYQLVYPCLLNVPWNVELNLEMPLMVVGMGKLGGPRFAHGLADGSAQ